MLSQPVRDVDEGLTRLLSGTSHPIGAGIGETPI
jgi:hypothetical protein